MLQVLLTVLFYLWLFAALLLLLLIWRSGATRLATLMQALIDVSSKSADAAKIAAEAARDIAARSAGGEKKHES